MTAPFFGSGPFVHTDLRDASAADPVGYYISTYQGTGESYRHSDFAVLWRYVVPAGKKITAESVNVHYSHKAVSGFGTAVRGGEAWREAITTLLVDGSAVFVYEGKATGAWEGLSGASPQATQHPGARDAALHNRPNFGDGLALTNGQVLTATASIENLALTIDGIHPQVHRIRLFGFNTATNAPQFIDAVLRPTIYGSATYGWNNDETNLSYTIGSDGFTLLSMSFRTDIGLEWIISSHAVLYLNGVPLIEMGPFMQGTGLTVESIHVPLYGTDLIEGDVLELRGSPGVDCGQVVSAVVTGAETSLATYSRNRVWSP